MKKAARHGMALLFVLCLFAVCSGEKKGIEDRCTLCGMNAAASKGRFVLDFEDGTRRSACSGGCAAKLCTRQTAKLYAVRVYGTDTGTLIDGYRASYVLGAKDIPEGSMPPSVFAFSAREEAERFSSERGGHVGDLKEVLGEALPEGKGGGPNP
jgi:hypothetical protein